MSPETTQKLEKVRKYSTSLRKLFNFFRFFVVIGMLVSILVLLTRGNSETSGTLVFYDIQFTGTEITWTVKLITLVAMLIVFGVTLKLLRHLATLFGLYAEGKIFTAENVEQIRQIGISVFLYCLSFIYMIIGKLIFLATDHPLTRAEAGADSMGPSIDDPLLVVLMGTIIIVISWIMDVGRELREDQDLTV